MSVYKSFNQKLKKERNGPSAAVLKYDEGSEGAPKVVAHGRGAVANQIMELAKQSDVHMQENSMLVENLLDMDLGDSVPPQLYSVIAEILLLIEEMERNY